MKILTINSKPDLSYFTSRGLLLETTYKKLNKIFPIENGNPTLNQEGKLVNTCYPNPTDYFNTNYNTGEYDIIILGYTRNEYKKYRTEMANTGGKTFLLPLMPTRTYVIVYCTEDNRYVVHEIHHALSAILLTKYEKMVHDFMDSDLLLRPYFLNNDPENPLSNYGQTWAQIQPYLNILNNPLSTNPTPIVNPMSTRWKYFKLTEKTGSSGHTVAELKPELVDVLDKMREECGFPFKISSGFRTKFENDNLIDAVGNSAHLTGEAADIICYNEASKRDAILKASYKYGIRRRGIDNWYVHIDISKTLPQDVTWTY